MPEFKSYLSYWTFSDSVRSDTRYVRSAEVEEFLTVVRETGQTRVDVLEEGEHIWRAQLGHDCIVETDPDGNESEVDIPYAAKRMKPEDKRAREGRANPKGIPYLYFATTKETALAEVRPWLHSRISLGLFRITRQLKLLDCTSAHKSRRVYFGNGPAEIRESRVWQSINDAFARPVTPTDDVADYVPTQIIAELFKTAGFDGIVYRSSLIEAGNNVVVFDLTAAELVNCSLYLVKSLQFEFKETGYPYSVQEERIP